MFPQKKKWDWEAEYSDALGFGGLFTVLSVLAFIGWATSSDSPSTSQITHPSHAQGAIDNANARLIGEEKKPKTYSIRAVSPLNPNCHYSARPPENPFETPDEFTMKNRNQLAIVPLDIPFKKHVGDSSTDDTEAIRK